MTGQPAQAASYRRIGENLVWAAVVPGDGEVTPAAAQLLDEILARGIKVHDTNTECW